MKKFREGANRGQLSLLPASLEDYVSESDIVRYVDTLIDELDLRSIESKYSFQGRPAYSPRMLAKLLIFGKMRGIRSSRELAEASRENIRFMFLTNNEKPDFRTIIRFRKTHHRELASLLQQTIAIGVREQLISLEHVSIDGTKLRSFSSRKSFKDPEKLREQLSELEEELAKSFAEDVREDSEDDDEGPDASLPVELQNKVALREKIRTALKHYDAVEGEKPRQISISDPESRFMKGDGKQPAYNAQLAVDSYKGLAVGGFVTNACSDNSQLRPMLEEVEHSTGTNPRVVIADKGYGEIEGLAELSSRNIDGYVPQRSAHADRYSLEDFTYQEDDSYLCPSGEVLKRANDRRRHRVYKASSCAGCLSREQCIRGKAKNRSLTVSIHANLVAEMKAKTQTPLAKNMRQIRAATVERAFGNIKYCKKLRQLTYRGISIVNSMWQLELAAMNIEKIAKHHRVLAQ